MVARINYWFDTGNARLKMRSELPVSVDTIIIGGGIAGLSTLYHLLSKKINTILLDKTDIGYNASGRSNGVVGVPSLVTISNFEKIYDLVRFNNRLLRNIIAKENIQCDFNFTGELQIASSIMSQALKDISHNNILHINEEDLLQIIPSLKIFDHGIYLPITNTVNIYQLLYGLCGICELTGQRLFGNVDVLQITKNKNDIMIHMSGKRDPIICKNVVLCSNNCMCLFESGLDHLLIPLSVYATCTKQIVNLPFPHMPIKILDSDIYLSFYNHRIFIDYTGIDELKKFDIQNYFKYFENCDFEYRWQGHVYQTPDYCPLIGKIEDNIFINTGHGRSGLSYAVLGGKIISDYITNQKTDIQQASLFSPHRFS